MERSLSAEDLDQYRSSNNKDKAKFRLDWAKGQLNSSTKKKSRLEEWVEDYRHF